MKYACVCCVALIATHVLAPAATAQAPATDPKVQAVLQPWITCLYAAAKEAKAVGGTPEEATMKASEACGDGEQAIATALGMIRATEKPSTDPFITVEQARARVLAQVRASVIALPYFAFRELEAGRYFRMDSPGFKNCEKTSYAVTCTDLFDRVAGVPAITSYTIYERQLYQFWISTERDNLPTLLQAFTAKYGAPCNRGSKTVQNGLGAEFSSAEITWCFKSGKMVASEIGSRITHSSIIYTDEVNAPPAAPPNVDF